MQGNTLDQSELTPELLVQADLVCIQRAKKSVIPDFLSVINYPYTWSTSTDYGDLGLLTIGPTLVDTVTVDIVQNEYDSNQGKIYHRFKFNNFDIIHQLGCYIPVTSKNQYFNLILSQGADLIIGDSHIPRHSDTVDGIYQNYKVLNTKFTFMSDTDLYCIDWIMTKNLQLQVVDEYVPVINSNIKMRHYPVLLEI